MKSMNLKRKNYEQIKKAGLKTEAEETHSNNKRDKQ
jgi:hypothetical protein